MNETQRQLNNHGQIEQQGYPECACGLGINKTEHYALKSNANSWRTLFYNAKKRENSLKQSLAEQSLTFNVQITKLQEELDSAKAQLQQ